LYSEITNKLFFILFNNNNNLKIKIPSMKSLNNILTSTITGRFIWTGTAMCVAIFGDYGKSTGNMLIKEDNI